MIGYDGGMRFKFEITRYACHEWPGFVDCRLIDAHGKEWAFLAKLPAVTTADVYESSDYPQPGDLECSLVRHNDDGTLRISTGISRALDLRPEQIIKSASVRITFKEDLSVDWVMEELLAAFPNAAVTSHDFYADGRRAAWQAIAAQCAKSRYQRPSTRILHEIESASNRVGLRKIFHISVPGTGDIKGDLTARGLWLFALEDHPDQAFAIKTVTDFLDLLRIVARCEDFEAATSRISKQQSLKTREA
jgi:hypothetical protein